LILQTYQKLCQSNSPQKYPPPPKSPPKTLPKSHPKYSPKYLPPNHPQITFNLACTVNNSNLDGTNYAVKKVHCFSKTKLPTVQCIFFSNAVNERCNVASLAIRTTMAKIDAQTRFEIRIMIIARKKLPQRKTFLHSGEKLVFSTIFFVVRFRIVEFVG
jgi:CRISPR/Cas system-associated endoribonuclease Cas2